MALDASEDKPGIATLLARSVLRLAGRRVLVELCSWERLPGLVELGFRETNPDGIVILDLTKGPDRLLREIVETGRRAIRKGIKSGVQVREAVDWADVDAYLRIREDWARRKGLPLPDVEQHRRLFQLRHVRRLFVATLNDEIIAGSVVRFVSGGMMEYAANASLPERMALRPNDVLQWRLIEWGCANGFTRYSLGGAHPFLRKFGGDRHDVYRYTIDRTLFRRHEIRERARRFARRVVTALPRPIRQLILEAVPKRAMTR